MFAGVMILNAAGFAFHMIASRRLGVAEYGALYAILSAYAVCSIPAALFAPVITRFSAEFRAVHDDGHIAGLFRSVFGIFGVLSIIFAATLVLAARPLGAYLQVPDWAIVGLGVITAAGLLSSALRSIVQGLQNFSILALSNAVEGAGKVTLVAVLAIGGLQLGEGMAAIAVGLMAGFFVCYIYLSKTLPKAVPMLYDWRRIGQSSFGSAVSTFAAALLASADVLIVKHFYTEHDAGIYSAAALCGKSILYLIAFVPAVLLPKVADRNARGEKTRNALGASLAVFAAAAAFGILMLTVFRHQVLTVLVGPAFYEAEPLLPLYAVAMTASTLVSLLSTYGIATHRLRFAVPMLVASLATVGLILAFRKSLFDVVYALLIGNCLTVVVIAIALLIDGAAASGGRLAAKTPSTTSSR